MENKTIEFAKGTVEDILIGCSGVSREALALKHPVFKMEIKNDDLVFTNINKDIARTLYYDGLMTSPELDEISCLDLALSTSNPSSLSYVRNKSRNFMLDEYNENAIDTQLYLMCHICMAYFTAKYSKIKDLEDLSRAVPIALFSSIVNGKKKFYVKYTDGDGNEFAGRLTNFSPYIGMMSQHINIAIEIISRGKDGFVRGNAYFKIPYVNMALNFEDVGLSLVSEKDKARLTERGRIYVEATKKPAYLMYRGFAHKYGGWYGDVRSSVNGRIMVDINAMRTLNPRIDDEWYFGSPFNECETVGEVKEDALFMCSPVVYGFSFLNKEWLRMNVNGLSEIEFSETAFDELIVPQDYKDIFMACLTHDMPSLDSIEGKGAGKIFLLYGPAGCGKTMTAESVSEFQKRPLYYVSVGELGISPKELEESLAYVMDIALSWNAIILLDEVDVFAQDRTNADIEKTAMTAILLRLLEKFSGTMFMTTNLKANLDPAFISRATACIPYEALQSSDRAVIWKGLLKKTEKLGMEVCSEVYSSLPALAEHNMNGREIKNNIRLAYSVALSKKEKITMETIGKILKIKTA